MADPEIGLAPSAEQLELTTGKGQTRHSRQSLYITDTRPTPQARRSPWQFFKRKSDDLHDLDHLDEKWPIIYRDLTFETALPRISPIPQAQPQHQPQHHAFPTQPLPPPPDLSKYSNPFKWSPRRKDAMIWLSCISTVFTAFTAGCYSPGAQQMSEAFGVSHEAILVGITTFTCGFAIAPMALAPFSEINGRRPVFIVSGLLFVICQLCCAVTDNYAGMLLARFFVGVGGSVFSTMVGGVVSDMYGPEDRNTPMSLFSGGALFGTGFGPIIGSLLAQHTTWRWMFWEQFIVDAVLMVFIVVFFKETRGSVLLSRKAALLNSYYADCERAGYIGVITPQIAHRHTSASADSTLKASTTTLSTNDTSYDPEKPPLVHEETSAKVERIRWRVAGDEERASLAKMIMISLSRPFHLLFTEPVVFFFSLWVSFSWAVLYMTLAAIPLIYTTNYGMNIEQRGAVFTSICVGAILFTIITIYQEKWGKRPTSWLTRVLGTDIWQKPESRLVFATVESALLPIGLFIFGWTAQAGFNYVQNAGTTDGNTVPWIAPTIALTISVMGIFSIYLAVFNYMADAYGLYASSALAAQSFCRNIVGGAFPLVTNQLFENVGYGAAGSLLGGLGTALTLVPWVLFFYGPQIRKRSRFALQDG